MAEENCYSVYKHTFPNGKVYIGVTKVSPYKRWANGKGYMSQCLMWRAIEKYGWENIKHDILFQNLSKNEAELKEIELIRQYKSADRRYGYNVDLGGRLKAPITEETKQKLSSALKGREMPLNVRRKISETTKGEGAYWYGRKHTEKTKKLISGNRKGKCRGIAFTNERKNRISKGMLGNDNAPRKVVLCVETGIIYKSAREAGRKMGVNNSRISECCRGLRQTCRNYHWKYVEG